MKTAIREESYHTLRFRTTPLNKVKSIAANRLGKDYAIYTIAGERRPGAVQKQRSETRYQQIGFPSNANLLSQQYRTQQSRSNGRRVTLARLVLTLEEIVSSKGDNSSKNDPKNTQNINFCVFRFLVVLILHLIWSIHIK